jgi:hypothetical protein
LLIAACHAALEAALRTGVRYASEKLDKIVEYGHNDECTSPIR